ncbi:MAG: PaaI family thioesterase [Campylobacteraceae bacterium]|jgi:acyl-coenzyme A thioesterase PaaI-like protein|nr:PaaI family thioesterase [Campylobacteraceae bacterium]
MAEENNEEIVQTHEEDFSETFETETVALHPEKEFDELLRTHRSAKSGLLGGLISLEKGYSKVTFQTTNEMSIDELGLVHSGFIFASADYAAATAVNEENTVIIGSRVSFLAPAKVGDLIEFEAKAKFEDSRKREISVVGKINDIKIFDGLFHAVVLDKHIFKVKIKNVDRKY